MKVFISLIENAFQRKNFEKCSSSEDRKFDEIPWGMKSVDDGNMIINNSISSHR
jgi:hypothetical protein